MLRCVYFGTPSIAAHILEYLLKSACCEVVGVVTRMDRPQGRSSQLIPSAVKVVAQQAGLPLWQAPRMHLPESLEWLKERQADLFIVVAFGEILRQIVLDVPRLGCINVHASLLPAYRGAAPMQWSLIHGDPVTGITIQKMVLACDAGDLLGQSSVAIDPNWTRAELELALENLSGPLLQKTILELEAGTAVATPQDESQVTWAPKIELADCVLDFHRPALELHRLICGVSPEPGAWCWKQSPGKPSRLRILRSAVASIEKTDRQPGDGWVEGKHLYVACGEGVLELLAVQLEGKGLQPIQAFINGLQSRSLQLGTAS